MKRICRIFLTLAGAGAVIAALHGGAAAQSTPVGKPLATPAGLTSSQMASIVRNAKPMEIRARQLPRGFNPQAISSSGGQIVVPSMIGGKPPQSSSGPSAPPEIIEQLKKQGALSPQPGTAATPPPGGVTTQPGTVSTSVQSLLAITPDNYGAGNLNTVYHYNDLLLDPGGLFNYPTSAVGWLLFTFDNSNWAYCSGALISKSIVVAAGHCVYKEGGGSNSNNWIKQAYFLPACFNCPSNFGFGGSPIGGGGPYYPYGYATALYAVTTGNWYATGAIQNGYDIGIVVLSNRAGTSVEIGNYSGWFGFCYSNCLQSDWFLTQKGYPFNYTNGNWQYEGQHLEVNCTDYCTGSGAQGGSSGGPHISNIGAIIDFAANVGQFTPRNIIFATTSWGYIDQSIKIQGNSSLSGPGNSNDFRFMFNLACSASQSAHGSGSCSLLP